MKKVGSYILLVLVSVVVAKFVVLWILPSSSSTAANHSKTLFSQP